MATLVGTIVTNTSTDITTVPSYQSTPTVVVSGSTLIFTHSMWQYGTLSSTSQALHYASTSSAGSWSPVGAVGPEVSGLAPLSGGGFAFGYSNGSTDTGGTLGYFTSVPPSSVSTESRWTANPDGSVNTMHAPCAITVGSNVALVYGGPQRSSMGSGYGQIWLQQRTGTNTYAAAELVTDAANIDYSGVTFAYGLSNGRAFFILGETNTGNDYVRYRTSSGTYNTPSGLSIGVSRVSSGVVTGGTTINVLIVNGINSAYLTTVDGSTDTPTVNVDSTYIALPTGTISDVALGVDSSNDKLYALVRNNANGVYLYTKAPGDSAWSSAYQVYSGATSYPVSNPVIYTNGSSQKVMGFAVVTDSGSGTTVRWYEEVLASAPSTPTTAPTVSAGAEKVTVTTPALATSTNAVAWSIYRDGTLVASGIGGSTAYDDTGASVTASQTYTVRGTSSGGTSADSPASSSVVADPGTATFALSSSTPGQVDVAITRRPYAAVYKVYRGFDGGSRALVHTSTSQVASGTYTWNDTSVIDLEPYQYSVIVHVDTPTSRDGAESSASSIVPNLWTSETVIPTARSGPIAFPVTGGFYMGQGSNGSTLTTAYWYDTASNAWTAKNAITGLTQTLSSSYTVTLANGVTYVMPQSRANADVYWYNEATDTWTLHAVPFFDTTTPAKSYVFTAIGNTIYTHCTGTAVFRKWTPGVDSSWTVLTPLPKSPYNSLYGDMARAICAADDGYIYAITVYGFGSFRDGTARYNPATDTWTHLGINTPYNSGGGYMGQSNLVSYMNDLFIMHLASDLNGTIPQDKTYLWKFDVAKQSWSLYDSNGPGTWSGTSYIAGITPVLVDTETNSPSIHWLGGRVGVAGSYLSNNRRAARKKKVRYYGVGTLTLESVVGGSFPGAGAGALSLSSGLVSATGVVATAGAGQLSLAAIIGTTGACAFTGVGTITGLAATLLLPPANLTATPVSSTQINLTWDAATGATGYDIERNSAIIANNYPSTSYSDSGLTQGQAYTYRVRSVKIES